MQLGVIDLGPTGAYVVRRLLAGGHRCVVFDRSSKLVAELGAECAYGAASVPDLVNELDAPRAIWLAGPAGTVDGTIAELRPHLEAGDIIVVSGNSRYVDDVGRARALAAGQIHYVDVGINGRLDAGPEGCSLAIGGEEAVVRSLDPIFAQLTCCASADTGAGKAEPGYLHCGPAGAGHFVSMVHDNIACSLRAAYSEGLGILHLAAGSRTTESCQYDFDLLAIAELWRRGSSVTSSVLDRTAGVLAAEAELRNMPRGRRHGRQDWCALWVAAAEALPVPVLAASMHLAGRARHDTGFSSKLLRAVQKA